MQLLFAASPRHLARHPAQLALALLGLALGVGTLTAVDIATASAGRAFELSLDAANGAATHQIIGGAAGLDEHIYADLRTKRLGLELAPVIEGYIVAADRSMQLLGIDPLVDERVRGRSSIGEAATGRSSTPRVAETARRWLLQSGSVVLAAPTATQLGLRDGAPFEISVDGRTHQATLISTVDNANAAGFDNLMLTDIAQAQEWLGLTGRISRIDVRVPSGERGTVALQNLRRLLPGSVQLVETQRRAQQSLDMSRAFTINLQAMSLLGLLVSVFLIYSAVSFSMVQRRQTFGLLRAIGATRANLFVVALGEATLLGIAGTVIGIACGLVISRGLIALVSRTINDLYFVVAVNEVVLPSITVVKAIVAGLCVTLAATALPVAEVVNNPPRVGLRRSALESRARQLTRLLALASVCLAIAAALTAITSHRSLFAGFAALLMLLLAVAALAPSALEAGAALSSRAFGTRSAIARIAISGIAHSLSRTGVAVAALAMAVAAMIGVAIMVDSFRESLLGWLERSLHADFYVSAPGPGFARPERKLDPVAIERLLATPGVRDHSAGRRITVESERGPVVLDAVSFARSAPPPFELTAGSPDRVWPAFAAGALVISEPLAWRLDLAPGAHLTLITAAGPRSFPIAGIYREYGNDRGNALISREAYRRQWHDDAVTVLGLYLARDVAAPTVERNLRHAASSGQALLLRSNRELRDLSMSIFDRTFVITRVLNWLAAGVAAIALSSALLAWQLERSRELAVLRSLGLTPRGAAILIELQALFMGFVTFLAAVPAGLVTAVLLIEVINRRAFGWQIALHPAVPQFGNASALAIAAALVAGLFPAWRASRAPVAADLREE